jgi:hypothetical protein
VLGSHEGGNSTSLDIQTPCNEKTNNRADPTPSAAKQTTEGVAIASALDNAGTVLESQEDRKSTSLDNQTASNEKTNNSADSSPSTAENTTGETTPGSDFDNAGTLLGPDEDGGSNSHDIPTPSADHQNNGKTSHSADSTPSTAKQTTKGAALASAFDSVGTVLGKSTSLDNQTPSKEKTNNSADYSPSTAEHTTGENAPGSGFANAGTVLGPDEVDRTNSRDIPTPGADHQNN